MRLREVPGLSTGGQPRRWSWSTSDQVRERSPVGVSNRAYRAPVPVRALPTTEDRSIDVTTNENAWTDEQLLLTAEEAAKALLVGRTTLYAHMKDGQLHSVHIGRSCRLTGAELRRYVTRLDTASVTALRKRRRRAPADQDGTVRRRPHQTGRGWKSDIQPLHRLPGARRDQVEILVDVQHR